MFSHQVISGFPKSITHIIDSLLRAFATTSLTSKMTCPHQGKKKFIEFKYIIGKVAGSAWMSDYTMYFALAIIARGRQDCFVVDPVRKPNRRVLLPDSNIKSFKYILPPQNIDHCHWVVSIIEFDWATDTGSTLNYDPFHSTENYQQMRLVWESFTLPLLGDWIGRDHCLAGIGQVAEPTIVVVPRQGARDTVNCGFLCVAVANSILQDHPIDPALLKNELLSGNDLLNLRVRVLRLLLCDSDKSPEVIDDQETSKLDLINSAISDLLIRTITR